MSGLNAARKHLAGGDPPFPSSNLNERSQSIKVFRAWKKFSSLVENLSTIPGDWAVGGYLPATYCAAFPTKGDPLHPLVMVVRVASGG
jgi:hypothetical protein